MPNQRFVPLPQIEPRSTTPDARHVSASRRLQWKFLDRCKVTCDNLPFRPNRRIHTFSNSKSGSRRTLCGGLRTGKGMIFGISGERPGSSRRSSVAWETLAPFRSVLHLRKFRTDRVSSGRRKHQPRRARAYSKEADFPVNSWLCAVNTAQTRSSPSCCSYGSEHHE